jgi:hypothetical protein
MTLSDLASLGSFVSGIAVLISLIFLYIQLRQLNQQVRQAEKNQQAAIQQARSYKRIDMQRDRVGDAALRESWRLSNERPDDMTVAQYTQFSNEAMAAYFLTEDTYYQRKQGLISDIAYDEWLSNIRRMTFTQPGIRALWPQRRALFPDEFAAFIDKLIDDSHPRAFDVQASFAQWKADAKSEIEQAVAGQ